MARGNVDTVPINHEDLSDELILLGADDMAFTSMVKKGKAPTNVVFKAPVDKRLSGRLGGLADGEDVNRSNVENYQANRDDLEGVVQHFRETHGVTTLQAKVMDPAGINDTFEDGRVKAMVRLKEDMELTFLSQQDCKKGSTTADDDYLCRGASMWIDDGAQPNADYDVASGYRPLAAQVVSISAVTALKEANLRTMLKNLRSARKGPVKISAFGTLDYGEQIDTFFTEHSTSTGTVPVRQFTSAGGGKTYEIGITRYKTRYGYLDIIPTTFLNGVRNAGSLAGAATTSADATVTVTSTTGLQPFMRVYGTGIPAGAYIASITNATTFELSAAATATGSPTLTLGELDHALYLDMDFFEVRTSQAPQGYEMPITGGGRDGVVECITSLFCSYPAVHGKHHTDPAG
jgi:hypothetical protein